MTEQQQSFSSPDPDPYQGTSLISPASKPVKLSKVFLTASDIDAFMALQAKMRPTLLKPYHLKERTHEDLQKHFDQDMPAFGVKTNKGQLVGFGLLTILKNEKSAKNLDGYPILDWQRATTAVAQTVCVDPDFKGRGISRMILDSMFSAATKNSMERIVSAIADDNIPSQRAFESAGYQPFAQGIDPNFGYQKTYYSYPIGCNAA